MKLNVKDNKLIYEIKSDELEIRCPFTFDKDHICYISSVHKRLRLFNHVTKEFSDFAKDGAIVPTELALPAGERESAEKLESMYRDGTSVTFLKESKLVCLLEMKNSVNTNSNDNVVTVF